MNIVWPYLLAICSIGNPNWGFYAHRIINQQAVFSLPPELIRFYKNHIGYLQEHAVDPDKRRYASDFEAVRHYIDLDHWGEPPFKALTRNFRNDVKHHLQWFLVESDSMVPLQLKRGGNQTWVSIDTFLLDSVENSHFDSIYQMHIWNKYYDQPWVLKADLLFEDSLKKFDLCIKDELSSHGIVPYYLPVIQQKLTRAFASKSIPEILKISAEIGHYIADATVPLHTTENYNGQLSGQQGIHAFWETQIPELLLEDEFNLWAGKAQYIQNIDEYYWDIVLQSHELVPTVFQLEKEVRLEFDEAQQYCYEWRNNQLAKLNCKELITAFYTALKGQVDGRMRLAISAVASSWLTAWTDAGRPILSD